MEEVYEYDPPTTATSAVAAPSPPSHPDVIDAPLSVSNAFGTFAALNPPEPGAFEAPRAKLARLRRETAELRAELMAEDHTSSTLVHDVDDLITTLERIAAGLPSAVSTPPLQKSTERHPVEALGGGEATSRLLEDAAPLSNLPASLVTRLAALKQLHEAGFHFASRLDTAEREQVLLRATLEANDDAVKRITAKLDTLTQRMG